MSNASTERGCRSIALVGWRGSVAEECCRARESALPPISNHHHQLATSSSCLGFWRNATIQRERAVNLISTQVRGVPRHAARAVQGRPRAADVPRDLLPLPAQGAAAARGEGWGDAPEAALEVARRRGGREEGSLSTRRRLFDPSASQCSVKTSVIYT